MNNKSEMDNNEEYVDVNSAEGIEIKPKKKKETFESFGIEYKKTTVCKHCKEDVEVNAEVCPHCGHYVDSGRKRYVPISEKKAWHIKFVLGVITIVVFLIIISVK